MQNDTEQTSTSRLLNNRYQIIQLLGDGGFGQTFLAEDTQIPSRRRCVVKQLKPVNDNSGIYQLVQERFQREAALIESLGDEHDQIPRLYAYFSEQDLFYLVEEWIEGKVLSQLLHQEDRLSELVVRNILRQLLPVVDFIHQKQIIHRDIKPDNIILRDRDNKPVLLDFGAVKETMGTVINSKNQSSRSIVVGTNGYMPVEQIAGRPTYGSDLYSLGMTAIHLLTGKLPQEMETDPQTSAILWQDNTLGISPGLTQILDQAVQIHATDRYTSAQQMLSDLESLEDISEQAVVALASSSAIATIISAPSVTPKGGLQSGAKTQPTQISQPVSTTYGATGDWRKAVITGGIIGGAILLGAFLISERLPNLIKSSSSSVKPEQSPSPAQTPQSSPQPLPPAQVVTSSQPVSQPIVVSPPAPAQIPSNQNIPTNATIAGKPGYKNIRSGPSTASSVVATSNPGDRVQVLGGTNNQDGYLWYRVYVPSSNREGWIASHLVDVDGQAVPSPRIPAQPPTPVANTSGTNAIIAGTPGSKNIRTGPGTSYPALHIAYPGDRVRIIDSGRDKGGYLWYKVYFPTSGASGWIAGQLIDRD
jgi:serine/threonine protein kinase, bacterial